MSNEERCICCGAIIPEGRYVCPNCINIAIGSIRNEQICPTVDAVEVVRCKDCKHWSELKGKDSGKPVGYGDCRNGCGINGIAYEDSFCSYGERRTDDGNV